MPIFRVVQQDSIQIPEFEAWRFVPYAGTLLFNFKDSIGSEDEAIALIADSYRDVLMGVRRVASRHIGNTSWIIIDTCLATNAARAEALKNGVQLKDGTKILPVTTCLQEMKYTYLALDGAPLLPDSDQNRVNMQTWTKNTVDQANKHYFRYQLTLTAEPIAGWMMTDSSGVFRGKGSAVFQGYDRRFSADYIFFETSGYDYPRKYATVKGCYMFCRKCQAFNAHEAADCIVSNPIEDSDDTTTKAVEEGEIPVEHTCTQQIPEDHMKRSVKRKLRNGQVQREAIWREVLWNEETRSEESMNEEDDSRSTCSSRSTFDD